MKEIACPHCTFLNKPDRVKCAMCMRHLRKRSRPTPDGDDKATDSLSSSKATTQSTPADTATPSDSHGGGEAQKRKRRELSETSTRGKPTTPLLSGPTVDENAVPALVPTLFSTASGKPVEVKASSLAAAKAKLKSHSKDEEESGSSSADESDDDNAREARRVAPPQASSTKGGPVVVATLFSTASGKPVEVKASSLAAAKAKLKSYHKDSEEDGGSSADESDDDSATEAPRATHSNTSSSRHSEVVATLFSTASGKPVEVKASSLAAAKAKLNLADSDEEVPANSTASPSASEPVEKPAQTPKPASVVSSSSTKVVAPTTSGFVGSRKAFVPPQQRTPAVSAKAALPVDSPTSADPSRLVTFPVEVFASIAPVELPSFNSIADEAFHFRREWCGPNLCQLMGMASSDQTVQPHHWRTALHRLGASPRHCNDAWCGQAVLSSLLQLRQLAAGAEKPSLFSVTGAMVCLCHKYNKEVVEGHRSALRKVTESDVPAASLMVLYVSTICEERSAPHTRTVKVSDGHYHLKATLDVPLTNLLREGVLKTGEKLAVCGAKLLLHSPCSPTECVDQLVLSLSYNCVRPVSSTARLGLCLTEPAPLPLRLVHPSGGLVPALRGVVARVLPPFFITEEGRGEVGGSAESTRMSSSTGSSTFCGGGGGGGGRRTVRNLLAQQQYSDSVSRRLQAGVSEEAQLSRRVQRVTSVLLHCGDDGTALLQQWEDCSLEESASVEADLTLLPQEGAAIVVYALHPSRSRTAAAPFGDAKLFYSSRTLHFTRLQVPVAPVRHTVLSFGEAPLLSIGGAIDFVGLFLQTERTDSGQFLVLLLRDEAYALLHVPMPSSSRTITLPTPPTQSYTPLLVQNGTFLCHEDVVIGEDCTRVLANEYTVLTQRSSAATTMKLLSQLAADVARLRTNEQKHMARTAEILRCATDPSYRAAVAATVSPSLYASSVPDVVPEQSVRATAAVSSVTTARVPYYLRPKSGAAEAHSEVPVRPRGGGVVLPPTPFLAPLTETSRRVVPSPSPAHLSGAGRELYHFYGNVIQLSLSGRSGPRALEDRVSLHIEMGNSEAGKRAPDEVMGRASSVSGGEGDGLCFSVRWRYSNEPGGVRRATIRQPRVLEKLLQPALPISMLCATVSDERYVELSLQREAVLAQWRSSSVDHGLWWSLLTRSQLTQSPETAAADDENASKDPSVVWWLPSEWQAVEKALREALAPVLYKFTVSAENEVSSVYLVSESCDVIDLFP